VQLPARDPLHVPDHGERGGRRPADGELPAAPAPAVAVPRGRPHAGAMDGHHGLAAQEHRLAGLPPPLPLPVAAAGHGQPQDPLTSPRFGWHVRIFCSKVLDRRPRRVGHSAPRAPGSPGRPGLPKTGPIHATEPNVRTRLLSHI